MVQPARSGSPNTKENSGLERKRPITGDDNKESLMAVAVMGQVGEKKIFPYFYKYK